MSEVAHTSAPIIDVHAHLVPADLLADLADGRVRFPNVEVTPHDGTHRIAFAGGTPTRPVAPGLTDGHKRSQWLADNKISHQVVGGWLDIFGYDLPASEGREWSELLTESIIASVADDRSLVPLGTVPLQDPARAAAALRAQRAAGLPGVMIASRAAGRELDDAEFIPFWEAADESEAVVFIHPGFGGASERYQDFGLVNGLARLEDTTVTLARLLYAGIPARYGRVRIVAAHGGAALPYVLGRLVRNHLMAPGATADPLESFAQLFFDSVIFDPAALGYLVGKAGAGRVLLGSDYPFPIGDLAPRQVVESADLPHDERQVILGASAAQLFLAGGTS